MLGPGGRATFDPEEHVRLQIGYLEPSLVVPLHALVRRPLGPRQVRPLPLKVRLALAGLLGPLAPLPRRVAFLGPCMQLLSLPAALHCLACYARLAPGFSGAPLQLLQLPTSCQKKVTTSSNY